MYAIRSYYENGDHFSLTNDNRLSGFNAALQRHGLSMGAHTGIQVYHTEVSMRSGRETAREVLARPRRPTAIICLADIQAVGVYEECKVLGLSIPGDISVFGFDDIPLSPFLSPPLATVHQPGFRKGETATRLLVDLINKKTPTSVTLETELILRESLGPAPGL